MLSMVRAELFRMVKSRSLVVFSFVVAAWTAVQTFSIWTAAQPEFGMTSLIEGDLADASILTVYGTSFVSGSPFAALVAVFVAAFAVADFTSKYVKNLMQTPGGRAAYAVALGVSALPVAAWFALLGLCCSAVTLCALGQAFAVPFIGEFVAWFVQLVLVTLAYSLIVLAFVFLTKNEVVGLVVALALGFGWVETMLAAILQNTPGVPGVLLDGVGVLLAADLGVLGRGALPDPAAGVFAAAVAAVAGAACALVMRRRSLA